MGIRAINITDKITGDAQTVNTQGRGDVVQHAHPSQGVIHLKSSTLEVGTERIILIDMSDTLAYPHTKTDYSHLEWINVQIDADLQAQWLLSIGFLDNVQVGSADVFFAEHWSGKKSTGTRFSEFLNPYPNGWKMLKDGIITSHKSIGDVNYGSSASLLSLTDLDTANVTPAQGDVIIQIEVVAGSIEVKLSSGYHTHYTDDLP